MNRSSKEQLREINEALLASPIQQHELAEQAKKAETAVHESEDRYRTLFDLIPVAVYSCDASDVIQKFNRRAVELWGREPVLGDTDERFCGSFKLFRPDGTFMPHDQCPMAEVVSGKIPEVCDEEVLIERPDGSRITVVVNIHPLKDQHGKITGAINCFYDVTDRKQAEKAKAHLVEVVTSSDDAIITKNLDGIIQSWNEGAQRLFGYTAEEAIGQPATLLMPPDRVNEESGILERIRRGAKIDHYETVRQRKDGSLLDISLTVSPLRDATGRIMGASKIARDITDRMRAEAARRALSDQLATELAATQRLQEISARMAQAGDIQGLYEHIINAAVDIMHSDMASMQTFDAEKSALRMLSYHGFDDEFGKSFEWVDVNTKTSCGLALRKGHRIIVPDIETFEGIAGTPACEAQRAVGIRATQSTPLFSRTGHMLGMISTHWRSPHEPAERDLRPLDILARQAADLIERAQSEAALRNSEVRYRRFFQAAQDGILILDAQTGKIIDANAFISGLVGMESDQLPGKELWEIGLFPDISANKAAFQALQEHGYVRYEQLPVHKPNGEVTQVEFISNVYQENNRLMAQCNIRDITARAAMERQIQKQSAELADQHRRKDEFLAMLSHELRNPLAPIRSATHILRLQERGSENLIQQQAREVIERQVTNLTKLVSDLMEVSRMVSGRVRLDVQNLDINQVVEDAVETAKPLIEQRQHKLSLHLPDTREPIWVQADPLRIEEVFVNLLSNATKYTEEGGRIEVIVERHQNDVLVRVRDSGIGIEEKLLPHIFDLFTQANRSLDRAQGGLGIGLSVVQQLVELHGGTVEARSEGLGKGSEFIVRLPLVHNVELQPAKPAAEHVGPEAKGLRVLVVDDNVDACTTLAKLLRLRKYSVQTAYTGPAALEAASSWRPDVILLDIGLPQLDGYEVARRLRAVPELRKIKLIAVTGYGNESDLQLAVEAGFDAHLLKPADLADVEKLLATSK